jgi:hypothetical protein
MEEYYMYENFRLKRGLNPDEEKEYDHVLGVCSYIETVDNNEYQERLFNLIKSIIDNHNLDYISKLEKLNILLTTNKSLELYSNSWKINGR